MSRTASCRKGNSELGETGIFQNSEQGTEKFFKWSNERVIQRNDTKMNSGKKEIDATVLAKDTCSTRRLVCAIHMGLKGL